MDFHFFKNPVYPYGLKGDFIVSLELKVALCSGDAVGTYKLSDIFLEHDARFDEGYAITIGGLYTGTKLIPYINASI